MLENFNNSAVTLLGVNNPAVTLQGVNNPAMTLQGVKNSVLTSEHVVVIVVLECNVLTATPMKEWSLQRQRRPDWTTTAVTSGLLLLHWLT